MSESILEIPLDIPEEVKDIVEHIEEIKAKEPEPPQSGVDAPASEEVKPVIKPKAKGRPKGALNKAPSKPRTKNGSSTRGTCGRNCIRTLLSKAEPKATHGSEHQRRRGGHVPENSGCTIHGFSRILGIRKTKEA